MTGDTCFSPASGFEQLGPGHWLDDQVVFLFVLKAQKKELGFSCSKLLENP